MDDRRSKTAGSGNAAAAGRRERLAAALRENLRKRKAQARSRTDANPVAEENDDGAATVDEATRRPRR